MRLVAPNIGNRAKLGANLQSDMRGRAVLEAVTYQGLTVVSLKKGPNDLVVNAREAMTRGGLKIETTNTNFHFRPSDLLLAVSGGAVVWMALRS